MQIVIEQRSGIVTGFFEMVILLILSPIVTRGTANIFNFMTTRRVFSGNLVKISDTSMSVEDLLPRTLRAIRMMRRRISSSRSSKSKIDISRQCTTLLISFFMSSGILLLTIFTDGKTLPKYEHREVFVWNGGTFVDTTKLSGQDSRAADVLGMAAVRSSCVVRIDQNTFELYGVAFFEKQNFEGGQIANFSLCINGQQTQEKVGVRVTTNRIFNPPADPVYKDSMEGRPANFTFIQFINRTGTPDYCRVNVSIDGHTEEWTLSNQDLMRTRFATRATRRNDGSIRLKVGVAFHYLDSPDASDTYQAEDCNALSVNWFAGKRFTAKIIEIGMTQDLRHLELVVADMMMHIVTTGYGRLESQDILLRAYYAGASDSQEDQGEPLGTFIRQRLALKDGEQEVTELALPAVIGLVLTLFGSFVLFVAMAGVRPEIRLTSTKYISRLYREDLTENDWVEDSIVAEGRVGTVAHINENLQVRPVYAENEEWITVA